MTKLLLTVADNYTNFMELKKRSFDVDLNGACTLLTVKLDPRLSVATAQNIIQSALEQVVEIMPFVFQGQYLVQPATPRFVEVSE